MFRLYNFKSLLAWTAGSLAGNQAYYETKKKQAGRNTSSLSAKLAEEYQLYKQNGGSMELQQWLEFRASPEYFENLKKQRCEEAFGKFDPNLEQEVINSLAVLNNKIKKIESAIRNKKFNKNIFEDIYIIALGCNSFVEYYVNTISHITILHNVNYGQKAAKLFERFQNCATSATQMKPALWESVQKEMNDKFQNNPRLRLKLATWKIVQLPSS